MTLDHSTRRRWRALVIVLALLLTIAAGCFSETASRKSRTPEQLLDARRATDESLRASGERVTTQLMQRIKMEHDTAGTSQPVVNMLIISGGGDWGAFAAGFLKGWERVPPGPMAKPTFDVVTGTSTGALIAPFAYLGDAESTDAVLKTYRNPQKSWVKPRGWLSLLKRSSAYADIPGLEEDLRNSLDLKRLARIAKEGEGGRALVVNVTNIDTQEMHVWDVVSEARHAVSIGKGDRVYDVLLASAALPGVFPPREIDDVLYVDGGITGNILWGGPQARKDEDTFIARWKATYPGSTIPKLRYWVIFNNEIRWPPQVVEPSWSAILAASSTTSTRAATLNSMRMMFLQAHLAKEIHGADVEVRVVAVPDGWVPPKPGVFVRETMNALADLGEKMGADPACWRTTPP